MLKKLILIFTVSFMSINCVSKVEAVKIVKTTLNKAKKLTGKVCDNIKTLVKNHPFLSGAILVPTLVGMKNAYYDQGRYDKDNNFHSAPKLWAFIGSPLTGAYYIGGQVIDGVFGLSSLIRGN